MHSCDRHDLRSIGWWVGKSSAIRQQPAMLWKERLWILHICPISSQRSCLQKWRICSRATSYQRNGIVANGKSSLAYPRGPCLQYCMSICGDIWTDALHAAHFGLLFLVCKIRWAGLFSLYCTLANTMCVCVRTCVLPYLFMFLVYLEFKSHPWSTCLLLYLSLSLVCKCWPGFDENHYFLALDFVHVSVDS